MTLTRHAVDRYRQRVGPRRGFEVQDLLDRSVLLPRRIAAHLVPMSLETRRFTRVRVTGGAIFVCRGRSAVTCVGVGLEELASLLVWACCGVWP